MIIASFCVLAAVLAVSIFRLICAYELGQVPCRGADTGGCCDSAGCGFVFVCSSADRWTVVNGFDKTGHAIMRRRNILHSSLTAKRPSCLRSMPTSAAEALKVECAGGKYICSIFTLLEHENRFEGDIVCSRQYAGDIL